MTDTPAPRPAPYFAVAKSRYGGPVFRVVEVVSSTAKSHSTRELGKDGRWGVVFRTMRRASYPAAFPSASDAIEAARRANDVWAQHSPGIDAGQARLDEMVKERNAAAEAAMNGRA